MNIALLTGRGGLGSAFPGKNTFLVNGRPLMEYSILAAKRSRYIDDIYISTEGESLKTLARKSGVKIIDRPIDLAQATSQHIECIEHALDSLSSIGIQTEILVVLLCNVGIHPHGKIDECVEALNSDLTLDAAVTIREWGEHHPTRSRTFDSDGLIVPILDVDPDLPSTRQLLEPTYYIDSQVWAIRIRNGKLPARGSAPFPFLGRRVKGIHNLDIVIDVHNMGDVAYTEMWLRSNAI